MSDLSASILHSLAVLPYLLACIGGIVAAAALRRRSPAASTLAIVGLSLLALVALATPVVYRLVMTRYTQEGWTVASMGVAYAVVSLVDSVVGGTALVLLVAAAFVGRRAPAAAPAQPASSPTA